MCFFENSRQLYATEGSTILKIDWNTLEQTVIADESTEKDSELGGIDSIACDEKNNRLIALYGSLSPRIYGYIYDIDSNNGTKLLRKTFESTVADRISPEAITYDSQEDKVFMTVQGSKRAIYKLDHANNLSLVSGGETGRGPEIHFSTKITVDDLNQRLFFEGDPDILLMADIISGDRVIINW